MGRRAILLGQPEAGVTGQCQSLNVLLDFSICACSTGPSNEFNLNRRRSRTTHSLYEVIGISFQCGPGTGRGAQPP
jgi:hypothetical protein